MEYLSLSPKLSVFPSEKVNLLIDGTYFSNGICLVLYRDATIKFTQLYRLTDGEHYLEIKEGGTASTVFAQMASGEYTGDYDKKRKDLLEYCNLDTYAMVRIFESLKSYV